jgi:hypothetical protein
MNVDPGSTSHLQKNICPPKAPPAPVPLKLDPNLSAFGGETTSTLVSNFLSDLHYNPYPSVKRFSATPDSRNEFKQLFQFFGDTLMEWIVSLKIILEAPNHLNNHDITCTYNVVFSIVQRENEA